MRMANNFAMQKANIAMQIIKVEIYTNSLFPSMISLNQLKFDLTKSHTNFVSYNEMVCCFWVYEG